MCQVLGIQRELTYIPSLKLLQNRDLQLTGYQQLEKGHEKSPLSWVTLLRLVAEELKACLRASTAPPSAHASPPLFLSFKGAALYFEDWALLLLFPINFSFWSLNRYIRHYQIRTT